MLSKDFANLVRHNTFAVSQINDTRSASQYTNYVAKNVNLAREIYQCNETHQPTQ